MGGRRRVRDKRSTPARPPGRAEQTRIIHTINEHLSGPVLAAYRVLLPSLDTLEYQDILANPELVNGCLLLFEKQRDQFQHLLVSESGLPVTQ